MRNGHQPNLPPCPYGWFTQISPNFTQQFKYTSKGYLKVKYLCWGIFESHGFMQKMEVMRLNIFKDLCRSMGNQSWGKTLIVLTVSDNDFAMNINGKKWVKVITLKVLLLSDLDKRSGIKLFFHYFKCFTRKITGTNPWALKFEDMMTSYF